jgi:hypothetical protein
VAAFGGVAKIQNGGRYHGNQGTKWPPNTKFLRFGRFPTSKSTWKPNFAQIGELLYFGGHFGFKMSAIANQR